VRRRSTGIETIGKRAMTQDRRLYYKLNITRHILLKRFDRETTAKLGVPIGQIAALFYLRGNEGCPLKDLSEELSQNKSAITTLVERMEKNDLVVRKTSETDGRAFQLFLTEKGRMVCDKAITIVNENNRTLAENFSDDEMDVIHRFFDKVIEMYK
jgi:DNA-binding MarR family transcriptional regulator